MSSTSPTSSFASSPDTSAPTSSSFFSPPPSPSESRGSPTDGSSSATLYLYTFLATLVLLLSVSAAIILRSLILRRRHQRMVEEAIRNGTWVPPSPGASGPSLFSSGGRRVDPTKKPRMWEAFVGSREKHAQGTGKTEAVTEWEWDSIRPFAAAYVNPPGSNDPPPVMSDVATQHPPSLTARMHSLFRDPHQRSARTTALAEARMTPTTTMTPVCVTAAPLLGGASPLSASPDTPQKVRVAVLIAMPQPPETRSRSPTPVASTSAAVIPHSDADEETELPHIEFGVAELDVSHTQSNRNKDVRSSLASGTSVI